MILLLIQPPIQDFYDTEIRLQPLGLAYLKAVVRQYLPEIQVKILDFHQGWGRQTIPLPAELDYLKPYYPFPDKSPFCTFHQYFHFGLSFDQIAEKVAIERPDVVGISSLFSPYYREALETASVIKKKTGAVIVMGGSHASVAPETLLEHPDVDFVIRGEGEKPLVEFLMALKQKGRAETDWSLIQGLSFKINGRAYYNDVGPNYSIKELPHPDLSDFPLDQYSFDQKPLSFVLTSRGCPHHCSFCSVHTTFGSEYRRRLIDDVMGEIRERVSQGYRVFDFEDDNLTYYQDEMKALCRAIIDEFPDRQLQLLAMNGISYLSLDSELLHLMREAGFTHLNLALVSSDQTILQTTKRPHTIKKYLDIVKKGFDLGFHITSYQILGLPFESLESMIQTLVFNARLPVLLGASPFYLTPQTPIAKKMGYKFSSTDILRSRLTAMAFESDECSRDDIYTLFVTTRIVNFLKSFNVPYSQILSLEVQDQTSRTRLGLELVKDMMNTGVLKAATPDGWKPLQKFRFSLFQKIWDFIK